MAKQKRTEGVEKNFSIKFSEAERALIGQLTEERAKELRELGITEPVTIASYLRWLIHREAQTRNLGGAPAEKRKKK